MSNRAVNSADLFKNLQSPSLAVRELPLYQHDGRFRLIVNELLDNRRASELTKNDLFLRIGYLFTVIADLSSGGGEAA